MVFDSLDIACLRFSVQLEQRKKPGQHFMPIADLLRHRPAGIGQRERPVFLVMKIPLIRQLLHHTGDTRLSDPKRLGNIGHMRRALALQ